MTSTGLAQGRQRTAVRAAWLVDGTSATLQARPMLILEGGKIVAVDHQVDPRPEADVVDLAGAGTHRHARPPRVRRDRRSGVQPGRP